MSTKKITEGAIMIAIYAVMLLIFLYLPILGVLFTFALPIPFMYFTAKHGWKDGLVFFVGAVIISFIIGNIYTLPATFMMGLTGVVYGIGLHNKMGLFNTYILATLTFVMNTVIFYFISAILLDVNYFQELIQGIEQSINEVIATFETFQQDLSTSVKQQLQEFPSIIVTILPYLLIMSSGIFVLITQLISFPILKKLGISLPNAKPFRELSLPKKFVWYFLLIMILSMFVPMEKGSFIQNAIVNLLYIIQTLFTIQGITFLFYFAHQKKMHKAIPAVVAIIFVFNPVFIILLNILGIIDVGFDLRKRIKGQK
ncbi:YybS family protein [Fervidibacillus halotolerans]|uniref:YybS family protein n=1 Tax=Fervidibacillus halotolerans TaxID=2980027 RepID=A0A9E8M0C1_9BACI|nr:YybS family protein [Fervidibacillus halotolerans]WAA12281.1 YybS family protein [Fervidibacillus halotolerans]